MATRKKTVEDLSEADLKGKKVLIRCDLNVPLDGASYRRIVFLIREFFPMLAVTMEGFIHWIFLRVGAKALQMAMTVVQAKTGH